MKLHFFSELERVYTRMSFEFVLFLYLMNDEEFLEWMRLAFVER